MYFFSKVWLAFEKKMSNSKSNLLMCAQYLIVDITIDLCFAKLFCSKTVSFDLNCYCDH